MQRRRCNLAAGKSPITNSSTTQGFQTILRSIGIGLDIDVTMEVSPHGTFDSLLIKQYSRRPTRRMHLVPILHQAIDDLTHEVLRFRERVECLKSVYNRLRTPNQGIPHLGRRFMT